MNALSDGAEKEASLGHTPLFLAIDGELSAIISLADPIKEGVKETLETLRKMGLQLVMLSGDNVKTAEAVARQLGIEKVIADVLPQDKARHVREFQEAKHIVGMVGDGINDAPALSQADVGFALGAGTDIAIESADVTLIGHSILGIAHAIRISKATIGNIKQNLVGAFLYNTLGVPVAAGVLYPILGWLLNPIIAGLAMAASSLTVVLNANRLRFFKP